MQPKSWLALGLGLAGLLAAVPGHAEQKARPEPRWALTWEAAAAEAKERNVPIFFSQHQDG
jgi:hypothetical protein